MTDQKRRLSYGRVLTAVFLLTAAAVLCALCFGSARLSPAQVWRGFWRVDPAATESLILWASRLPRTAGCLLAGAGLALSGLLLQAATNNPLAGPNIIGVNAGAGFAMVLGMCFAPMAYRLFPLMAFAGAFLCTLLIVFVAAKAGGGRVTIVLTGVAVSTLLGAGISLLRLVSSDLAISYTYFSVGGVSGVTFDMLAVPGVIIALAAFFAAVLARRIDLLCLGDEIAAALGVRVKGLRMVTLLLSSAGAAAAVSFAGLLGFVGLMVPHMARAVTGEGNVRRLLPVSLLLGSTLVVLADLLGRVLFAPSEVPAGIITAFVGAPFFFFLLMKRRGRL